MSSIFTKIIQREIPAYVIAENEQFMAFLDVFPIREGHVLVVPKQETDKWYDLSSDLLQSLLIFAQPIARAIEHSFPCNRCGISMIGLEVPHAHLHLVPIDTADDLNFTRPKLKLNAEQLQSIQQKILQVLNQ
jgi:histidine triad (HIT) family protein